MRIINDMQVMQIVRQHKQKGCYGIFVYTPENLGFVLAKPVDWISDKEMAVRGGDGSGVHL
jgi:hypothetical protein